MDESLQERYARERKERQIKLQTARNQRAIQRLREPASERMSREREERIDAKRVEAGRASKLEKEPSLDDVVAKFVEKILDRQPQAAQPDGEALQRTQQNLGGGDVSNLTPRKDQHQDFHGVPIEFYCWKEGKIAIIELYAKGTPSPL